MTATRSGSPASEDPVRAPVRIGRWRSRDGQVVLIGSRCTPCGEVFFPERRICARCRAEELSTVELSGPATLRTFTVVHELPLGFSGPVAIGYAEIHGGPLVLAPIDADPARLRIGMLLDLAIGPTRTDDGGAPIHTYRFTPATEEEVS